MTTRTNRGVSWVRKAVTVGAAAATVAALASCSNATENSDQNSASSSEATTLTVYAGQHEETVKALADGFTAKTGIKVVIRAGEDAELVNQILEEGDASPADLYLSEEPGPIGQLDAKGLLSTVDANTLTQVDANLVPGTKNWVPYAARARVMFYNPTKISEDQLPDSIMDLADPKWKGQFAYAPSGAFAGTVSYLISTIGEDDTLTWLKAIKDNGVNEQKNGKVRDTVEAGQHAFGLSNHYYWWILAGQKGGEDKLTSKVHFMDQPDAGSLVLASGAGILKSSKHQDEGQQFLSWLTSADGGQKVVAGDEDAQFPVGTGVTSQVGLPPLSDLHPPKADQGVFSNLTKARELIVQAGIA
ncbi:MAG TPA: extracellular solute-binding protein [Mycobacteriales bacterium]|jgi:ABC-type Fe3+ transport system, periplasmic component